MAPPWQFLHFHFKPPQFMIFWPSGVVQGWAKGRHGGGRLKVETQKLPRLRHLYRPKIFRAVLSEYKWLVGLGCRGCWSNFVPPQVRYVVRLYLVSRWSMSIYYSGGWFDWWWIPFYPIRMQNGRSSHFSPDRFVPDLLLCISVSVFNSTFAPYSRRGLMGLKVKCIVIFDSKLECTKTVVKPWKVIVIRVESKIENQAQVIIWVI